MKEGAEEDSVKYTNLNLRCGIRNKKSKIEIDEGRSSLLYLGKRSHINAGLMTSEAIWPIRIDLHN